MNKINNIIEKNIEKIILIYLFFQPILDVLTGISMNYFNINTTISSILRLIFLIFAIYYLIFLNKTQNKKRNIIFITIIGIYILVFTLTTITYKDLNALTYELKNTINTFYFPITLITLIDIFKQYNINFKLKNILYIYVTYILLIIIPNITNTSFLSYSHSKLGNVGWFISANAVGNILSILTPFIIIYLIKIKTNKLIKGLIIISILYVLASMGTKVPILSLGICIIGTFIYYFIKWTKEKKYKNITIISISTIILVIICTIIIPKTSFYKNLEIHKKYLGLNSYFEVFTKYELIDHFIFSQRLTFLNNTNKNFQNASVLEKLFGIGYIENYQTDKVSTKTIEIDYCEIFYRHGIIGFIIYFSIIISILLKAIKRIKENNLINTEYKISIILILLLALFAGHILVTPAVSIFVALIITIILKGGFYEKIS